MRQRRVDLGCQGEGSYSYRGEIQLEEMVARTPVSDVLGAPQNRNLTEYRKTAFLSQSYPKITLISSCSPDRTGTESLSTVTEACWIIFTQNSFVEFCRNKHVPTTETLQYLDTHKIILLFVGENCDRILRILRVFLGSSVCDIRKTLSRTFQRIPSFILAISPLINAQPPVQRVIHFTLLVRPTFVHFLSRPFRPPPRLVGRSNHSRGSCSGGGGGGGGQV